jgi:hypothetical protein
MKLKITRKSNGFYKSCRNIWEEFTARKGDKNQEIYDCQYNGIEASVAAEILRTGGEQTVITQWLVLRNRWDWFTIWRPHYATSILPTKHGKTFIWHYKTRVSIPSGRAVLRRGSATLGYWDCKFESRLSAVHGVCCQVEVSSSGWSLLQGRPTEYGVSEYDRGGSRMRRP